MAFEIELSVGEFVALLNQTLEFACPSVIVVGELANFRVSKSRWVHFDLKDEEAVLHCFGTVYGLPGPLADGMMIKVFAQPKMHPLYGFSLNIQSVQPSGEGAIKKAANLLEAKLAAEGLFEPARKRLLPYPPAAIGLIASAESAAYSDFVKVLGARWGGVEINLIDVQVQGEPAAGQIVRALERFNQLPDPPEVLALVRGGGSGEDLQAFSTEQVTRAVAASRIPTLVAIGHERDISLAELAADQRASTPSNAAELLVPDRGAVLAQLQVAGSQLAQAATQKVEAAQAAALQTRGELLAELGRILEYATDDLGRRQQLLAVLNPRLALERGFVLVRKNGRIAGSVTDLSKADIVELTFHDGTARAAIQNVSEK